MFSFLLVFGCNHEISPFSDHVLHCILCGIHGNRHSEHPTSSTRVGQPYYGWPYISKRGKGCMHSGGTRNHWFGDPHLPYLYCGVIQTGKSGQERASDKARGNLPYWSSRPEGYCGGVTTLEETWQKARTGWRVSFKTRAHSRDYIVNAPPGGSVFIISCEACSKIGDCTLIGVPGMRLDTVRMGFACLSRSYQGIFIKWWQLVFNITEYQLTVKSMTGFR